ncbi:MAG TPA: FHA domain-containing protein [Bacteroidales bacterium]|nr:FHA domain-containing protein [Bacteroidales bacterium]
MMRIVCPECKNNNDFSDIEHRPAECSFCFCVFDASLPAAEITAQPGGVLRGLKLIYQQTGDEIIVESAYCIIGRENTGAELLRKILYCGSPVISRKHCSITVITGEYWLKDEGSSNGTFLGVDKKNCSVPQKLSDGDLFYLGREAFMVKYMYEKPIETKQPEQQHTDTIPIVEVTNQNGNPNETNKAKKYRCNEGCGFETETYEEVCPKCYTCGSLVEISS